MSARPSLTLQGAVGVIQELVVRPAQRRREIGESLLQYAKGLAVERGYVRLECTVPATHQPAASSSHPVRQRDYPLHGTVDLIRH